MNVADVMMRIRGVPEFLLRSKGGPANLRRRLVDALARCFVLSTDRIVYDRNMVVPCRSIIPYVDPVDDPNSRCWPQHYQWTYPASVTPVKEVRRKDVLMRIARGDLGIEDKLGVWNGGFWRGIFLSGAVRRGPGTELHIWQKQHAELVADMETMPLMKRVEPRASRSGLRRLRRCYASLLPPGDSHGRAVMAGLFAGAALAAVDGEQWLVLPDDTSVRVLLAEWTIPMSARLLKAKPRLLVSPFFAALVADAMPSHSAKRILALKSSAGCPFLAVAFWDRALSRKGQRYMPFPNALPWGVSRATFFRRGWHRRDLHRVSAVEMGILSVSPRLLDVLRAWYERRTCERTGHEYDQATYPIPPGIGIPDQSLPPVIPVEVHPKHDACGH